MMRTTSYSTGTSYWSEPKAASGLSTILSWYGTDKSTTSTAFEPTLTSSDEAKALIHPMKMKMPTTMKTTRAKRLAKNILKKLLMGYIFFNGFKNKDI